MTVRARIDGDILRIKLPLQEPKISATGKSKVIATTRGAKNTGIEFGGSDVYIVANAFIANTKNNSTQQPMKSNLKAPQKRNQS